MNKIKNISRKKLSRGKKALIILGIMLGTVLLVSITGGLILNSYLNKIKYDPGTVNSMANSIPLEDGDGTAPDSSKDKIDAMNKLVEQNMKNNSQPLMYDNDVFNVLLIGSDTRAKNGVGRSDAMILISINKNTSKIVQTSLLRDIYVGIPNRKEGNRLNAAYAFGGPSLLMQTIQQNFKIKVDKYASVDFYSFISKKYPLTRQLHGKLIKHLEFKRGNIKESPLNEVEVEALKKTLI